MHLLLTDRLACPRCGPEFGLILLAHDVRAQRVHRGELGCPNCRQTYPVEGGVADLRSPPRGPLPPSLPLDGAPDPEETVRVASFLGVTEGPGTLLLKGPAAGHAPALSRLIPGVEVVADHPGLGGEEEREGVSRIVSGARLPFFDGTFRGGCLSGRWADRDLEELARVVAPPGRVVAMGGAEGAGDNLAAMGLEILANEGGVVVARRPRPGSSRLATLRGY